MGNAPELSFRGAKRRGNLGKALPAHKKASAKQESFTGTFFRQNVFDISGKGGYNKDVETRTVATIIKHLSGL